MPQLKLHDEVLIVDILTKLNAQNPALNFEMELRELLCKYLNTGLTMTEAVGTLVCVKDSLQHEFHKRQQKGQPAPWLQ